MLKCKNKTVNKVEWKNKQITFSWAILCGSVIYPYFSAILSILSHEVYEQLPQTKV